MQMSVLIEPVKGNGYRARGAEPFALCAEGATREEALAKLKAQVEARLRDGAEIVTVEIGREPHPWLEFAGMFKDDPRIDEWVQSMAEYRQQVEDDPNRWARSVHEPVCFRYRYIDIVPERQCRRPKPGGEALCIRIAIAVVTVEEQLSGWYTQLRKAKRPQELAWAYGRLAANVRFLSRLQILDFEEKAIERYEALKRLRLKVRKMDLQIAATALENGATLVTRNIRDFRSIPGLAVEDWSLWIFFNGD
jgi:tRNA(fMet)-specific endonuclease VapC